MNSKITLMAVVLAIGAAMIIATPQAAFAKTRDPVVTTSDDPINGGITATTTTTTTCENPSGKNAPQSAVCQDQFEETTTTCDATNKPGHKPGGHNPC